jgi:hypothetical protein
VIGYAIFSLQDMSFLNLNATFVQDFSFSFIGCVLPGNKCFQEINFDYSKPSNHQNHQTVKKIKQTKHWQTFVKTM